MSGDGPHPWRPTRLLLTCEHAGREIPSEYRKHFRGTGGVLRSHRGSDIGTLGVGIRMAAVLSVPLIITTICRLLVEVNRSLGHPELFSEYTRGLPASERSDIIDRYYRPHRECVAQAIDDATQAGHRVVHIGVHSFTDVWQGATRKLDIGLLFDPERAGESEVCDAWRVAMENAEKGMRVRFNEPYLGIDDGLTTAMRNRFSGDVYAGVEVEIRQGLILRSRDQRRMGDLLAGSLQTVLQCGKSGVASPFRADGNR
ncbi:MAG: N-formylglutamate amidohydrolase [Phycisphaeraceae bacterium]|nr:MAG: N-formylglutamate amidohydrolase [Phycisphaeraceae bacterium]